MFKGKVTIDVDSGLMEPDKKCPLFNSDSVRIFEQNRTKPAPAFVTCAGFPADRVCCHARPLLPVWAGNREGGGGGHKKEEG